MNQYDHNSGRHLNIGETEKEKKEVSLSNNEHSNLDRYCYILSNQNVIRTHLRIHENQHWLHVLYGVSFHFFNMYKPSTIVDSLDLTFKLLIL